MNKTKEEWIKYYENATKEDVIEDMMLDLYQLKQAIIKKEELKMHIMCIKETIEVWDLNYKDGYVDFEIPKKIRDVVFRSESDE